MFSRISPGQFGAREKMNLRLVRLPKDNLLRPSSSITNDLDTGADTRNRQSSIFWGSWVLSNSRVGLPNKIGDAPNP